MTDPDMDRILESGHLCGHGTDGWVDFGPGQILELRPEKGTISGQGIGPHLRLAFSGPGWALWAPRNPVHEALAMGLSR